MKLYEEKIKRPESAFKFYLNYHSIKCAHMDVISNGCERSPFRIFYGISPPFSRRNYNFTVTVFNRRSSNTRFLKAFVMSFQFRATASPGDAQFPL